MRRKATDIGLVWPVRELGNLRLQNLARGRGSEAGEVSGLSSLSYYF